MPTITLTIDTADADAARLMAELADAAREREGITIRTGGGTFTVDAARVTTADPGKAWTDSLALDAIALGLGTLPEWNGADDLEWIANVIGQVRDHPGDADPVEYLREYTATHGIDATGHKLLMQYVSEDATPDEDEDEGQED